ncbi:ABC-2 type transport system permease protein [Halovenus aranensis]|uniref:ABC-2 type transport system permease protein n=1 Tax=Halovenus aranensis TaxID=890420 RepID=A0A1G8SNK3_9EURY|nr:ABC transporter permease subunit [Halovenus aranensis]SDJ30315.1 ABC-2 type transport system permease protein [Halovenus aranensis]
MTWQAIARKDYAQSRDSKLVRYLLYFFVAVCLLGGYIYPITVEADPTKGEFTGFMTGSITLLLPLLAILLSYNSIVGERESGQLNLLLSLPNKRREVVFGKLVGRGLFLLAGVVVGLVGAGALVVYPFGSITVSSTLSYAGYILLTLAFGGIFYGIGLAVSTFTTSKRLATMTGFGAYFLFVLVWDGVRQGINIGLERLGVINGTPPDWLLFVYGIEPTMLYDRLVAAFFEEDMTGAYLSADASWYLGEWVALALFLTWVVVPLALGYWRFEVTDL